MSSLIDHFFTAVVVEPLIALDLFLERGVRPKTRRTDEDRLRPFLVRFTRLDEIVPAHVDAWLESLAGRLSYASRQSYAVTLKTFFNWCVADPRVSLSQSPAAHLKAKRARSARNKAANEADVLRLIAYLQDNAARRAFCRDLLAIRLYYESGCRLTEVATLTNKAMNQALRVGGALSRGGVVVYTAYSDDGKKGAVPVRFTEYTAAVYRQWCDLRPRGAGSHRVFVSLGQGNRGEPLQPIAVSHMLVRRCQEVGMPVFRTHALRHLKGTKTTDKYGPAVAASMLSISFAVAQMHYYDDTERAVIDATSD